MIEAVIVASIATWRLTRLIMEDEITKAPRDAWMTWLWRKRRFGRNRGRVPAWAFKVGTLFTCWWCLPVWVAAPVVAVLDMSVSVPAPVLVWWCAAGGATLIWQRT